MQNSFIKFAATFLWCASPILAQNLSPSDSTKQSSEEILTTSSTYPSKPYSFIYGFDFDFLLDNLEESQIYHWPTRTLFSAALHPEIGFSFYNQNLKAGIYTILDMGHQNLLSNSPNNLSLTLSYDFSYKGLRGVFGIFPRSEWIGHYSNLFYRKDYLYYHPLSSGIMFQYQNPHLKAEIMADWTGGSLAKGFDEFDIQGFVEKSFFERALYFGASALLYHFLNPEFLSADHAYYLNSPDTYLLDRFYYQIFLGTDLGAMVPMLNKLQFEISNLSSLERKRTHSHGNEKFTNLQGFEFRSNIEYKGFGIDNSLYIGASQYKYFSSYGQNFYAGLPFYQSNLYDRAEFYYEYKNDYITGRFSVIFHFMQNGVSNQEMLTLSLDTHKLFKKLAQQSR